MIQRRGSFLGQCEQRVSSVGGLSPFADEAPDGASQARRDDADGLEAAGLARETRVLGRPR